MAVFQVETPRGVIDVEAPDDATDAEIIERAKVIYDNTGGPVEPETTGQEGDAGMNQARIVGTVGGAINAGVRPTVGAAVNAVRGLGNIASAKPITQTPIAAAQAGLPTQGSNIKIGDIKRTMSDAEIRAIQQMRMAKDPALAAAEIAPKTTAAVKGVGKVAGRFIGPYGAITSAQDATQRYQSAQGPMDYVQSGISALGSAGYGASMIPTPVTKFGGMAIGGAADLANMGIDYLRQKQYTDIDRQIREEAARRAMGQ